MLLEVIFERNKAVWINKMLLMLMYDGARDLTDGGRACGCCTRLMENKHRERRQHSLSCKQARNQDHLLFVLFYLRNNPVFFLSVFFMVFQINQCVFSEGFCSVRPSG